MSSSTTFPGAVSMTKAGSTRYATLDAYRRIWWPQGWTSADDPDWDGDALTSSVIPPFAASADLLTEQLRAQAAEEALIPKSALSADEDILTLTAGVPAPIARAPLAVNLATKAGLRNSFRSLRGATGLRTIGLGHSIMAGVTPTSGTNTRYSQGAWLTHAVAMSGGRLIHLSNAGVAGQTIDQIAARVSTDVAPYSPDLVIIEALTNSSTDGWSVIGPKVTALIRAVKAISSNPDVIWVLEPGKSGSISGLQQANRLIEDLCRQEGAYVFDLSGIVTNPADGTMSSTYGDGGGVHLSAAGAKFVGSRFVTFLDSLNLGMGRFRTTIAHAENTNLCQHASPPVGAGPFTGWTASGVGTGITWSSVAPALTDPITTNWIRATMAGSGSGTSSQIYYNPAGVSLNDSVMIAVWVKTVGMDHATATVQLNWAGGGSVIPLYQGDSSGGGGDTVGLWTGHHIINNIGPNYALTLSVIGDGAGTGIIEFGAPTWLNLTTLGIANQYADQ